MNAAVEIIRHVGAWMRDSGKDNYSDWWNPSRVSIEMLSKYAQPDEFYVVRVDGKPAAAAIIQQEQSMQDWSSVDKSSVPPKTVYIHFIAVEREFAGRGLVKALIDQAEKVAHEKGAKVLRLRTDANEPKLYGLYEEFGFKRVGIAQEGSHTIAFYGKPVAA